MTTKGFCERLLERRRRELIPVETAVAMVDEQIARMKAVKEETLARITALKLSSTLTPNQRATLLRLLSEPFDDGIHELEKLRAGYLRAALSWTSRETTVELIERE